MSVRQVVSASLMRYRWGLGGQAGTFGCLSNKVSDSVTLSELLVHPVHVRCVLFCCCISAVLECPEHLHVRRCCAWLCHNGQRHWKWPPNLCNCHQSENYWKTQFHRTINLPQCTYATHAQRTAMVFDMTLCAVCVQGLVDDALYVYITHVGSMLCYAVYHTYGHKHVKCAPPSQTDAATV